MKIEIKNRKAFVTLTKKQFEHRMYGLIQYLSYFCDKIEWNIKR
jgi:hypothetical protein